MMAGADQILASSPFPLFDLPPFAGASCARLRFQDRHQIDYRRRLGDRSRFDGQPPHLGLDQFPQRLLVAVLTLARVERPDPLLDYGAGDGHHLGVELALDGTELRCSNLVCARNVNSDIPVSASAIAADYLKRFDRDRAIRIEVIRAIEVNGSSSSRGTELLQVDDLRAFHVERLQFRRCDELAALEYTYTSGY
jgi:hypothetical protein